jgi:hypothetical protein
MSDPENPAPQPRRFQFRLRSVFLLFFVVAVLLGFWTLRQRQRVIDMESMRIASMPVALHVVYHDSSPPVQPGVHAGTATFIFKNRLPIKIKIAFPPISCACGGEVPFARNNSPSMPDFCRKPQLVELPPNGEVRFKAGYTITGEPDWSISNWSFMFGNPNGSNDDALVLTPVQSTDELR